MVSKTRLRKLSNDDIEQLKSFQEREHPLSGNFWSTVKSAVTLETPSIELHKCTCGTIIFVTRKYVKNSISSFNKNPDGHHCWHKKAAENNVLALDIRCNSALEIVSVAVEKNEIMKAHVFGHGYLPMDTNPTSFDYALWKMQWIMIKHKYLIQPRAEKNTNYQYKYISQMFRLFGQAEKKNSIEFEKIANYYFDTKRSEITNLINNGLKKWMEAGDHTEMESFSTVTKQYIPSTTILINKNEDNIAQRISLEASAFQDFFEISDIYNFIYNLINVINGASFDPEPFFQKITKGGISVIQKGKLVKGPAIDKICEDCPSRSVARLFKLAYDAKFRNSIPGHNDYKIDFQKSKLINYTNGATFSFSKTHQIVQRMKSVIDSYYMVSGFYSNLNNKTKDGLSMMGYLGILFHGTEDKKPLNELTIYQYWTNAELDKNGVNIKRFSVLPSPSVKGSIGLFMGDTFIVPGSYNFAIDKTSYMWLKSLDIRQKITVHRVVLAPMIGYFLKFSKTKIKIDGADFIVIGATDHEITINEEYLNQTLEFMRKSKPKDVDWVGGISEYETIKIKKAVT